MSLISMQDENFKQSMAHVKMETAQWEKGQKYTVTNKTMQPASFAQT